MTELEILNLVLVMVVIGSLIGFLKTLLIRFIK